MSDLHYKTKNFIFENSNGFNLIKNILKSDEKSEVKQKKMEDALNQVWNTEITDVLQNKKKNLGLDTLGSALLARDLSNLKSDVESFIAKGRKK